MTDEGDELRNIEDVAGALRQARERGDSASILIGAGASASAGIPLSQGFVDAVRQDHPAAYARAVNKTYPHVMNALDVGPRHDLIARYVDQAKLNWAHILLGALVEQRYVGRILTTNFDNLALRATGLHGIVPAVYDVTALARFDASLIRDPSVLFLHGQHRGFVQLHARSDVTRNAKRLRPIFADATVRRPWIVLGYSGDNDPVFECLSGVKSFPYGLYWIGYRTSPPGVAVSAKLLGKQRQAFLVQGYDADTFMIALFRALGLALPSLLADPFAHTLVMLDQFAPFPTELGGEDFTATARALCQNARRVLLEGGVPVPRGEADTELARLVLQGHLFRGDHDAVIAGYGGEVPPPLRRLVAIAHGVRAEATHKRLREAVQQLTDPQPLLDAALTDLDRAIALAPDLADLYAERAAVRWTASEYFPREVADELCSCARTDNQEALRLQPDMHTALFNAAYGEALVAQRQTGEPRRAGLERALAGFRRALEGDPDHVPTLVYAARILFNLDSADEGMTLLRRAEQIDPRSFELRLTVLAHDLEDGLDGRLQEFVARAEAMHALNPGDVRGRFILGLLQAVHAAFSDEPAARDRFDEGWRTYIEARDAPQWVVLGGGLRFDELRKFMACALSIEAQFRGEEAGADYHRRADAEFAAAKALPGESAATMRLWGEMLVMRADAAEGPRQRQLLDLADMKFAASLATGPDDPETLLAWVDAKISRIKANDAPAASLAAALDILRRVEGLARAPDVHRAWARACQACAETLEDDPPRCVALLREADARYERALAEDSEDGERWVEWAVCANAIAEHLAEAGPPDEARRYYRRALKACTRASELEALADLLGMQADLLAEMAEFEEEHGVPAAAVVLRQQAEALVEAAIRREPSNQDILELALEIYDDNKNVAGFAATVRALARLDPPPPRSELTADDFELLERPAPEIRQALALLPP